LDGASASTTDDATASSGTEDTPTESRDGPSSETTENDTASDETEAPPKRPPPRPRKPGHL